MLRSISSPLLCIILSFSTYHCSPAFPVSLDTVSYDDSTHRMTISYSNDVRDYDIMLRLSARRLATNCDIKESKLLAPNLCICLALLSPSFVHMGKITLILIEGDLEDISFSSILGAKD
jgi:hypothetical protein